jgi:hypothetical protein
MLLPDQISDASRRKTGAFSFSGRAEGRL